MKYLKYSNTRLIGPHTSSNFLLNNCVVHFKRQGKKASNLNDRIKNSKRYEKTSDVNDRVYNLNNIRRIHRHDRLL